MSDAPRSGPVIDLVLGSLHRFGYAVHTVAVDQQRTSRPKGCNLVLLFGEEPEGRVAIDHVDVVTQISIDGDIQTGHLRRWLISRRLVVRRGQPCVNLEVTLLLDGDISASFLRREGRAGSNMLLSLLADAADSISDLQCSREPGCHPSPVVVVGLSVVGDLASGRSGLLRREGGVQLATKEVRNARLAVCARLCAEILPDFASACLNAIAQSRGSPIIGGVGVPVIPADDGAAPTFPASCSSSVTASEPTSVSKARASHASFLSDPKNLRGRHVH